jgi:hypothetical protein
MEKLEPITARPKLPELTDRDHVEAVWLEHCHNKHLSFKDLMLLTLQKGRELQRLEDVTTFAERLAAIRTYTPPKGDDVSIYDVTPRTRNDDPANDLDSDRRALAREWNQSQRAL